MRVLILTCNTGGGHNAVAAALRDSLQRCGASCDVMDGLGFISKKASKFVSKWHTRFYRRYPRLYKAGYMSAEGDKEMDRRDGPVYRYIARGARRLGRTLQSGGYDAVVCVHVIPAMMMTALKQAWSACPVFCFVATDYTCSPTVGACTPDICVIPHQELADEFVSCGIARDTLLPAGIPVRSAFREHGDRAAARRALGLPETGRHIVLMSGSIGCGPMGDVAEDLDMRMADGDFATVLCGSNKQMRYALELRRLYRVEAVGFTTQVQLYMDSADVSASPAASASPRPAPAACRCCWRIWWAAAKRGTRRSSPPTAGRPPARRTTWPRRPWPFWRTNSSVRPSPLPRAAISSAWPPTVWPPPSSPAARNDPSAHGGSRGRLLCAFCTASLLHFAQTVGILVKEISICSQAGHIRIVG